MRFLRTQHLAPSTLLLLLAVPLLAQPAVDRTKPPILGRPAERVQIVTLATLPEAAARRDPAQPVVIAVGEVFRPAAEAAGRQDRAA